MEDAEVVVVVVVAEDHMLLSAHGMKLTVFGFLMLCLFTDFLMVQEAEAARRRRGGGRRSFFGRRFNPAPRRRVNVRRRGRNQQQFARGRNVRQNFDDNFSRGVLGGDPVDALASLSIDPTGSLSRDGDLRLIGNTNVAVDRNGRFFEQIPGQSLSVDRPLVFSNGRILGGAQVGMRDDTVEQVRFLNSSGALNRIR